MIDEQKPKVENLQQPEAEELTPEEAEAAEGGLLLQGSLGIGPVVLNPQPLPPGGGD
jgi:hypothetical protein